MSNSFHKLKADIMKSSNNKDNILTLKFDPYQFPARCKVAGLPPFYPFYGRESKCSGVFRQPDVVGRLKVYCCPFFIKATPTIVGEAFIFTSELFFTTHLYSRETT